jgi:hypothetical protein
MFNGVVCVACCSTTFITCPADPKKTLGIKLPFLVMIIKNLKKYFTFEVQVRTIIYLNMTRRGREWMGGLVCAGV